MAQLEPGATLSHYRILGPLGQGGQATAYKAEDLRLRRPVVIKVLRPELAQTDVARRRFDQEALLCAALEHPNVSAIYEVGESDGLLYIVMQFLEGRTVRELMNGRPLDVQSALSIAVQVADALAVAHDHGIVHRDIKPGNVIVSSTGQARVLDFGLAKMLGPDGAARPTQPGEEPATDLGVPYGSLGYGSPEQASGALVDHRSDIFSLGVLLYEMLTGLRPFRGRHLVQVLNAVINEAARPLRDLNPRLPPRLEAIVDRALAKDPSDRYQTIAALRDELKAVQRQLGANADAPATPALVSRRRARNPWFTGGPLGRVFSRMRTTTLPVSQEPRTDATPTRPSVPMARPASWGSETRRTVAVLPFKNLAHDPAVEFYGFSLADGVITELAHVESLVVRPSSYIAPYAGQDVDPRQVGEDLAVQAVLVGGFLKAPDRFRLTAQLIAAETGEILWSEKIDTPRDDLMGLQDLIAERVVAGLKVRLSAEEQAQIERPATRDARAHEFYLRGRDTLFRYTLRTLDEADLEEAIRMFNEAVGLDPEYARAHTALGRCYIQHAQGYGGPEYFVLAERALKRALDIDPRMVDARLQMVYVDLHHGDKERAHEAIDQLSQEAGNDPAVLFVAGMLYRLDGLYGQALAQYDRLLELNPKDIVLVSYNRARVYTHQRDYDRAIAELQQARRVEPDHPLLKTFLAVAHFNRGDLDAAQPLIEEVLRQHPHLDGVQPVLAWCLSARGQHERARALITDRVRETATADHDIAFWLASFYGMEGMADEAIEWVRKAIQLGNENYPLFAESRKLDNLRADPRFQALLEDLRWRWEARRASLPVS
jgi:serine/threonine protein kinase/tetratricopeptide (TPR) repeat protein